MDTTPLELPTPPVPEIPDPAAEVLRCAGCSVQSELMAIAQEVRA